MRRTHLLVVTPVLVLAAAGLAACDTGDGRTMRPPSTDQRNVFEATTTTVTTTTTLFPPAVLETAPDTLVTESSPTGSAVADSGVADTGTEDAGTEVTIGAAATSSTTAPAPAGASLEAPWVDGAAIDIDYTCDGTGAAPLINWSAPAVGTAELALAVTDDDAGGYVHWLVTGLPAAAGSIGGTEPVVGVEQPNSAGTDGWTPPCPPAGESHTYRVALYSLAASYVAPATEPTANILGDLGGAATATVEITGIYQRPA